jgi:hypothetical protein
LRARVGCGLKSAAEYRIHLGRRLPQIRAAVGDVMTLAGYMRDFTLLAIPTWWLVRWLKYMRKQRKAKLLARANATR